MKQKRKQIRTTSWGRVAGWYKVAVDQPQSYHQTLIIPNLLRLLSPKKGERVLDVGCGSGVVSEQFAKVGAEVIGIDVSKEFIFAAQERAKQSKLAIQYHVGSGEKMGMVATGSIDTILLVLVVQNMEKMEATFSECSRVLKKSGRLAIVMNHPVFRIPKFSEWGWDTSKRVQYRRVDAYLSDQKIPIQMHPGARSSEITTSFHRPLQSYLSALRKAGLCVANLEEWISNKKSVSGPRAAIENRARKEFPLFLYLEAALNPKP